jgi:hypothetical protein
MCARACVCVCVCVSMCVGAGLQISKFSPRFDILNEASLVFPLLLNKRLRDNRTARQAQLYTALCRWQQRISMVSGLGAKSNTSLHLTIHFNQCWE